MSKDITIAKEIAFSQVLSIIQKGQQRVYRVASSILLETYWQIGLYLSEQVEAQKWGKGVVEELAQWLQTRTAGSRGYSSQNLWRMKQLYELYREDEKLSPLVREIGWTQNCIIMAQCKTTEEREYYLQTTKRAGWGKRELEKQIRSGSFERTMLSDLKLSPLVRELPQDVSGVFKDSYTLDFLALSEVYHEKDLQSALVANLKKFLLELGDGFAFLGEKVRLQVGNKDFELDLLFFHRDLQCMAFRPVYHRREDRSDSHLFVAVLAYHLLNTIRIKLKHHDIHISWERLRKLMSTHVVITSIMKTREKKNILYKQASEAEYFHTEIYRALNLNPKPIKAIIRIL